MATSLRFHWSLSQVGDKFRRANATTEMKGLLGLGTQIDFCRAAEESGIESLLMAFGFTRPDPMTLSAALGMVTEKIKFMVACRPGVISPTAFVQQINTVSALTNGRICINIVTGHSPHELRYYGDFLEHDQRYARTDEFLTVCRSFWRCDGEVNFEGKYYGIQGGRLNTPFVSSKETSPEIFLGGNSELAEQLAIRHANCLWRFADTPENLLHRVPLITARGTEVGLLVSILARPTREAAVQDAYSMIREVSAKSQQFGKEFAQRTDSVAYRSTLELAEKNKSDWLTPWLWTGAIPYLGSPAIALVGSFEDIASALMEYKNIGISQFLFMGWPDLNEMTYFGREVLPLVREKEQALEVVQQVRA
ncbi:MAG TPA: LLM class flavin-dependent oxidoreductase [Candidatus Angelobacter sp.]|nr:LLM class flavin-dependent oxidoreductase [Candidatus Angelobacter sp.]